MAIRATAQKGIVFPAGNRAGVLFRYITLYPPYFYGPDLVYEFTVRTFLAGALQETVVDTVPSVFAAYGPEDFYGGPTTQPFDAVEFSIRRATAGLETNGYVFEFCSDLMEV